MQKAFCDGSWGLLGKGYVDEEVQGCQSAQLDRSAISIVPQAPYWRPRGFAVEQYGF